MFFLGGDLWSAVGTTNRPNNRYGQHLHHSWHVAGLWDAYGVPGDRSHHLSTASGLIEMVEWSVSHVEQMTLKIDDFFGLTKISLPKCVPRVIRQRLTIR